MPAPEPGHRDPPAHPLRKTARRYAPHGGVHYLTFSCYKRLPLLGNAAIRHDFAPALAAARLRHRFHLVAWVVMPALVHIIPVPTSADSPTRPGEAGDPLPVILNGLKKPFSTRVLKRWRLVGWSKFALLTDARGRARYWQPGGGFVRNVRDIHELARQVRYIHRNPVKRGLVNCSTDWPWSSARSYAGWKSQDPPVDPIRFDGYDFPGPRPEWYAS